MALTNCPMCSNPLEDAAKSCGGCGADVSRWTPTTPAPLPLPVSHEQTSADTVSTASGEFNLGRGMAGAVGGALVGMGAMFGFYAATGVRFPLLGVGTGFLTGFAARWFFNGFSSDQRLGIISAVAAMLGVFGALVLMYGIDFSPLNIISIAVSASVAYKMATR
jgi:hypothetical protein